MNAYEELRWEFQKLMHTNELSVDRGTDGAYMSERVRSLWVAYECGARVGIRLAPAMVAEKLST